MSQLSQEAYDLQAVLEHLDRARRTLSYLGISKETYAQHCERLNQITRELSAGFPALVEEIEARHAAQQM